MTNRVEYKNLIEKNLDKLIPVKYPEKIYESMRYSVLNGGKRLRPIMCLEACNLLGGNFEDAIVTACAIEMLHSQSLIYDDLPCMDNDDYRRGKLTNHKVFGEGVALLAGDALLSFAPELILKDTKLKDDIKLKVLQEIYKAIGAEGLVAGQIVDCESEGKHIDKPTLDYLHTYKTAVLFKCALKCGAIIANADNVQLQKMDDLGQKFGMAFQICDDILDKISTFEELGKTIGKDEKTHKQTYVTLFGLDYSKKEVICLLNDCCDIIGGKSEVFSEIIKEIREKVTC